MQGQTGIWKSKVSKDCVDKRKFEPWKYDKKSTNVKTKKKILCKHGAEWHIRLKGQVVAPRKECCMFQESRLKVLAGEKSHMFC